MGNYRFSAALRAEEEASTAAGSVHAQTVP